MRRFVGLVILLLFTIPFGISISGCAKKSATVAFCNGGDSGPQVGQLTTITLLPKVYGISLNYGSIGQITTPTASDCKGNTVSVPSYTYGSADTSKTIVDVQPGTGRICAGSWNRNSGAGVADYTYCIATNKTGTFSVVASADGANSNPLPVYVHDTVTSVVLGAPSTTSADCMGSDPATNCSPAAYSASPTSCTINPSNGCCTQPLATSTAYVSNACLSQGTTGQLAARVYAGTGTSQKNISCQVGHPTYTPQTSSVVTIDENGVATAQAPGSTIITANLANAGSSAGFFSTCPPVSITLSAPGFPAGTTATINPNNPLPLTTVVKDINNKVLTGLTLEFVSTTPATIPGASTIIPLFPGAAGITAICQPPSCNPSPFNQIGLFGNGTPILSNDLNVTSIGKNSTALYIGSLNSQYIVPVDFTTNVIGNPVRLPYVPNSMVISNDGTSIYMGSTNELMTFNALTNSLAGQDTTVMGKVLAVSPDNTTLIVTDPHRQLVYLYSSTGSTATASAIQTQYGGIGTRAEFSPDSQTVYITTGNLDAASVPDANGSCPAAEANISGSCVKPGNQLLVHSALTGWSSITLADPASDLAITVPSAGAFLAGTTTAARGQCPVTTTTTVNGLPSTSNVFYPDAGVTAPATDLIAATNNGLHIIGASASGDSLIDLSIQNGGVPTGACDPAGTKFDVTPGAPLTLAGVVPTAITGVDPTSDSSVAFVTYSGTGGVVPYYAPGTGTVANIPLLQVSGNPSAPVAPVAGVVSADNLTFFVGTSGDNEVHLIDRTTLIDQPAKAIAPNLPSIQGSGSAVPNLLVQRPRKSTS
jgi:trimeric autotransporter adhesin